MNLDQDFGGCGAHGWAGVSELGRGAHDVGTQTSAVGTG